MAKKKSDEYSVSDCGYELDLETEVQLDPSTITPYDFEPEISAAEDTSETESGDDNISCDDEITDRIGSTSWCTCTRCRAMETYQESLCCKQDVSGEILGDNTCITQHEEFAIVSLNVAVLRTTLSMLNNLRGDRIEHENISYRYAAYRQFTWWIHNRLGQGVRRVIPSCAIWKIRDMYPDPDDNYVPFLETSEEENRLR